MSYNIVCDQCAKTVPDRGEARKWLNVHDANYLDKTEYQDYDFCSWSCVMEFAKKNLGKRGEG